MAELIAEAPLFVIAAGAIESTRLLLLLDAQHNERIFAPDDVLGRYFYDHLSATAAEITPASRPALSMAFGFRFEHGGMRDCRLEPTAELRAARGVPGAFAHVAANSAGGGFAALRAMYRSVQRGSVPNLRDAAILLRDFGWLSQAVWWRLAKRRLLAPRQARFELVLVVEQMPNADNRISLSRDRDDKYGVPIAQIMWRPREADLVTFNKLQSALLAHWAESNLASLGTLTPTPEDVWQGRLFEGADIFHPGGSIRMGTGPLNGVVDRDLRTFRVGNLYVVSTATFPSGGSANPSFMLMAFALRAADRVVSELRDRPVPSLQT